MIQVSLFAILRLGDFLTKKNPPFLAIPCPALAESERGGFSPAHSTIFAASGVSEGNFVPRNDTLCEFEGRGEREREKWTRQERAKNR